MLGIYIYTEHRVTCNTSKAGQKLNTPSCVGCTPSCSWDMLDKLEKRLYRTVGSTVGSTASLEPLDHQFKSFL